MNNNWEVIDMERSICGTCIHADVCYRLKEIRGMWEPLARLQIVVSECEAYKEEPADAR